VRGAAAGTFQHTLLLLLLLRRHIRNSSSHVHLVRWIWWLVVSAVQ